MVRAYPAGFLTPETFQKRLPVAVIVLLLHIAALSLLTVRHYAGETDAIPEAVITFPAQPKKPEVSAVVKSAAPAGQKSIGTFTPPPEWTQTKPDFSAIYLALSLCGPENLSKLSQTDRARCTAMGMAMQGSIGPGMDVSAKSKAKKAEEWAAEIVARNTPIKIPCTYAARVSAHAPGETIIVPMLGVSIVGGKASCKH